MMSLPHLQIPGGNALVESLPGRGASPDRRNGNGTPVHSVLEDEPFSPPELVFSPRRGYVPSGSTWQTPLVFGPLEAGGESPSPSTRRFNPLVGLARPESDGLRVFPRVQAYEKTENLGDKVPEKKRTNTPAPTRPEFGADAAVGNMDHSPAYAGSGRVNVPRLPIGEGFGSTGAERTESITGSFVTCIACSASGAYSGVSWTGFGLREYVGKPVARNMGSGLVVLGEYLNLWGRPHESIIHAQKLAERERQARRIVNPHGEDDDESMYSWLRVRSNVGPEAIQQKQRVPGAQLSSLCAMCGVVCCPCLSRGGPQQRPEAPDVKQLAFAEPLVTKFRSEDPPSHISIFHPGLVSRQRNTASDSGALSAPTIFQTGLTCSRDFSE